MRIYLFYPFLTFLFLYLGSLKDTSFSSFMFLLFLIFFTLLFTKNLKIFFLVFLSVFVIFHKTINLTITILLLGFQKYHNFITFTQMQYQAKNLLNSNFTLIENYKSIKTLPTIYLVNYPVNKIEMAASLLVPGKLCFMMAKNFAKRTKLQNILTNSIIRSEEHNQYEIIKEKVKEKIRKKNCIFVYVSKQTYFPDYISELRRGIFAIAKELNVIVTPVYISEIKSIVGCVTSEKLKITACEQFHVTNVEESMKKTRNFFLECKKNVL